MDRYKCEILKDDSFIQQILIEYLLQFSRTEDMAVNKIKLSCLKNHSIMGLRDSKLASGYRRNIPHGDKF